MEALRTDVMTGRDLQKAEAEQTHLDRCGHCNGVPEIRFLTQKPYVACTECGATTSCGEDPDDAAAKWNRRSYAGIILGLERRAEKLRQQDRKDAARRVEVIADDLRAGIFT